MATVQEENTSVSVSIPVSEVSREVIPHKSLLKPPLPELRERNQSVSEQPYLQIGFKRKIKLSAMSRPRQRLSPSPHRRSLKPYTNRSKSPVPSSQDYLIEKLYQGKLTDKKSWLCFLRSLKHNSFVKKVSKHSSPSQVLPRAGGIVKLFPELLPSVKNKLM